MAFGEEVTGRDVKWGSGIEKGSFTARLYAEGERFSLFSVYTSGEFSVNFGWNAGKLDAAGAGLSEEYRVLAKSRLSLDFSTKTWERGWPTAALSTLDRDDARTLRDLVQSYISDVNRLLSNRDQIE